MRQVRNVPPSSRRLDDLTTRRLDDSIRHASRISNASVALRKKRLEVPYWLASGEQRCAVCERTHALAVTVYCVACDRPQCSFCITIVEGEGFCPDCHAEHEPERRPRRWLRGRSGKAS